MTKLHGLAGKAALALALVAFAGGGKSAAADYTVHMTSWDTFDPDYLVVQVGDKVTWVNDDYWDYHDSYEVRGYWYSGLLDYGESCWLRFPSTGTFHYEDTMWYVAGMTGTIVVTPYVPPVPIIPTAPTLLEPQVLADGSFQCTLSNLTVATTYIVQSSTNLVDWTGIYTGTASSMMETYVDRSAAGSGGFFYRCICPSPQ